MIKPSAQKISDTYGQKWSFMRGSDYLGISLRKYLLLWMGDQLIMGGGRSLERWLHMEVQLCLSDL